MQSISEMICSEFICPLVSVQVMSNKHFPLQEDAFNIWRSFQSLENRDSQRCHLMPILGEIEIVYIQFNLLTDLGQKREGTNISTASGIFLERKKKMTKKLLSSRNGPTTCKGPSSPAGPIVWISGPSFLQKLGHCI